MDGCYLLSLDGTGYFSSKVLNSPACLEKTNKTTKEVIGYYIYMLGASIVHPDRKKVISLCLEPIKKQDGEEKNDCERNAAKRLFSVEAGDTICIDSGIGHRVKNTGDQNLVILCCCSPPYSHPDTELL